MGKTLSEFSMLDPHVNSEPWDMYAVIIKNVLSIKCLRLVRFLSPV